VALRCSSCHHLLPIHPCVCCSDLVQVQFGSNAGAAEVFVQTCSSISSLAAAWPGLQQLLLGKGPGKACNGSSSACSSDDKYDTQVPDDETSSSAYAQQQQQQQHILLAELYTVSAELHDFHAQPYTTHKVQQQQQHRDVLQEDFKAKKEDAAAIIGVAAPEAQRADSPSNPAARTAASETAVAQTTELVQQAPSDAPAVAAVESDALAQLLQLAPSTATHHELLPQASPNAVAPAAVDADSDALVQVLPLPYAHYSLVRADGRPLERPDKHPFALSRVVYDAR
jgi:hypothetical protein